MIVIVNINSQKFSLNGVPYLKNFIPHVIGNRIRIVNVYDSKLVIAEFNSFDKFTVNGASYPNIAALQNALLPVLYSRNTLGFTGGSMQELDRIISIGTTDLIGNEVTFGAGFSWFLNQEFNSNSAEINRFLPMASEGMYRTHVAYLTDSNDILIQVGPESEDVAEEPNIPPGTLRLRAFNVFGEIVSLGSGPNLPFDMTLLDELTELDPDADIWMNINGLDVRAKVNLLLDFMLAIATDVVNSLDFLTIKLLASAPATPTANTIRFYSIANTVAAIFPDGLQISFVKNTTQNGTVTMPFHSGRMELVRPVSTLTGTTTYNFQETDTSRSVRVASGNMDFVIPSLVSGNHKYVVINQSNGVVRLTTGGVYRINGAFDPITLPQGEFTITRVATFDFVVNLPGGAPAWGGINGLLSNQLDLVAALNAKRDLPDLKELTAEHNLLNQVALQSLGFVHNVVPGTYELYISANLTGLAASGNIQFGALGSATITAINGKSQANKQNSFPTTSQIQDINTVDATPITSSSSSQSGNMEVTARITFSTAGNFIPSAGFGTAPSSGKVSIGSFSLMQKI